MEFISSSPEQTKELGRLWGNIIRAGDVLCLSGDLGAGKTLLVQGLALGLHSRTEAVSPTFTVMNVYEADVPIYHFDLYRLHITDELENIGFFDYVGARSDGVAVIEWPERFPEALPEEYLWLQIHLGVVPETRVLTFKPYGRRYEIMCEELKCIAGSSFGNCDSGI